MQVLVSQPQFDLVELIGVCMEGGHEGLKAGDHIPHKCQLVVGLDESDVLEDLCGYIVDVRWVWPSDVEGSHRLALGPQGLNIWNLPEGLVQHWAELSFALLVENQTSNALPWVGLQLGEEVDQLVKDLGYLFVAQAVIDITERNALDPREQGILMANGVI